MVSSIPRRIAKGAAAYHEPSTPLEALQLGAFEYLKKPFDFDQIAFAVARASATA